MEIAKLIEIDYDLEDAGHRVESWGLFIPSILGKYLGLDLSQFQGDRWSIRGIDFSYHPFQVSLFVPDPVRRYASCSIGYLRTFRGVAQSRDEEAAYEPMLVLPDVGISRLPMDGSESLARMAVRALVSPSVARVLEHPTLLKREDLRRLCDLKQRIQLCSEKANLDPKLYFERGFYDLKEEDDVTYGMISHGEALFVLETLFHFEYGVPVEKPMDIKLIRQRRAELMKGRNLVDVVVEESL